MLSSIFRTNLFLRISTVVVVTKTLYFNFQVVCKERQCSSQGSVVAMLSAWQNHLSNRRYGSMAYIYIWIFKPTCTVVPAI